MPGACYFFLPFHPPDEGQDGGQGGGRFEALQKVRSIRVSFHPFERPNSLSVF